MQPRQVEGDALAILVGGAAAYVELLPAMGAALPDDLLVQAQNTQVSPLESVDEPTSETAVATLVRRTHHAPSR